MFWNLLILDLMIMLLSWLLATLNGRAGIVDAAWSFCLAVNIIVSFYSFQLPQLKCAFYWYF